MPEATMQYLSAEKLPEIIAKLDLAALHPDEVNSEDEKFAVTRASIIKVLHDFLQTREFSGKQIELIDGFVFLFNGPDFSQWRRLNWWEQRRQILAIKDQQLYLDRAHLLLQRSIFAPYIGYADDMVAKSSEQKVKHAWMRKRLVLKECYWNAIDSISHAAYFKHKYKNQYPALCVILCRTVDSDNKEKEMVLGIDNGTGFLYKKKSRESALFHLIHVVFKYFLRTGIFYIGGLELGLLETDSSLSCHGSGAVVYQGW
jgi:hypothetical protein